MARDEAYSFLIFRQQDDLLVGGLSFGYVRRGVSQSASLGYWMGAPYAGNGYMKRAVHAACLYGFDKQGLNRIDAACLPANEPSKRLLERVGFRHEGYARAYLNINGDWRDHLLFGLLSKDLALSIKD